MRLCLHLLPSAILILVGAPALILSVYERSPLVRGTAALLVFCFAWLIIRQAALVSEVVLSRTFRENIYQALRAGNVHASDIVFYPANSKLMVDSVPPKKYLTKFVLVPEDGPLPSWRPEENYYFLWVNNISDKMKNQIQSLENVGAAQPLYTPPPDAAIGLYKLANSELKVPS